MVPLSILSWIFTFVRLRTILRAGVQNSEKITLYIWRILLSVSLTLSFMIVEFAAIFNAYTLPNLALLVYTCTFLLAQYFMIAGILIGMNIPSIQRIMRWIKGYLIIELAVLLVIYIVFVSKIPAAPLYAPQSFEEILLFAIVSFFGMIMCMILVGIQVRYFPAPKFAVMRLRTTFLMLFISAIATFLPTRFVILAAYLGSFPVPAIITPLSYILLILIMFFFFLMLLSNRRLAQFIMLSSMLKSWQTFQDLMLLVDQLTLLCPTIGLPPDKPHFWQFMFNAEYYTYRAIIIILDSKAMLVDMLDRLAKPDTSLRWDSDLHKKAIRINELLQTANPSNDFADIVENYRHVSRALFMNQKQMRTNVR